MKRSFKGCKIFRINDDLNDYFEQMQILSRNFWILAEDAVSRCGNQMSYDIFCNDEWSRILKENPEMEKLSEEHRFMIYHLAEYNYNRTYYLGIPSKKLNSDTLLNYLYLDGCTIKFDGEKYIFNNKNSLYMTPVNNRHRLIEGQEYTTKWMMLCRPSFREERSHKKKIDGGNTEIDDTQLFLYCKIKK